MSRLLLKVVLAALVALWTALVPAQAAELRAALVIGNGAYRNATVLPNPPNDAGDVARVLKEIGFRVIEGHDLDKATLEAKTREFIDASDGSEVALVFYAGHGMQVDGKNYLVPIDAKLERRSALDFEVVEVDRLVAQMEAAAKVSVVFLDACRDNPLARSFAGRLGRSTAVARGLSALTPNGAGTLIALSTSPGKVALDGDGRNSPFTTALLKHMKTPGLEISALMKRVKRDVAEATREQQIPWEVSSLRTDLFLKQIANTEDTQKSDSASAGAYIGPSAVVSSNSSMICGAAKGRPHLVTYDHVSRTILYQAPGNNQAYTVRKVTKQSSDLVVEATPQIPLGPDIIARFGAKKSLSFSYSGKQGDAPPVTCR